MSRNHRSRRRRHGRQRDYHISVRSVRRQEPDVRKLAKAVIALAMAQAEAHAQQAKTDPPSDRETPDDQ